MQRTFSPFTLHTLRSTLQLGQHLDLQDFTDRLVELGYHPEFQVNERGDMALRGGIVDFFPLDRELPVRVELAGDEVESIRSFDPISQQSKEKLDSLVVTPAGELGLLKKTSEPVAPLVDLLPRKQLVVLDDPEQLLLDRKSVV